MNDDARAAMLFRFDENFVIYRRDYNARVVTPIVAYRTPATRRA